MSQESDPFNGRPPPQGYGASISKDGFGKELWRQLICQTCGALVPDDAYSVTVHNAAHANVPESPAILALRKEVEALRAEVEALKNRYVIEEQP